MRRNPPQFEYVDDIGIYRPVGRHSLRRAIELVREAIAHAHAQRIGKLLIVITGMTGFDAPSLSARHMMVREWASAAGGAVRLAMVSPAGFIDPQKFGVTVAANFGLAANVFESEDEAIAWLRSF